MSQQHIQPHPDNARAKLVHATLDERTALAIAAFLRTVRVPATVVQLPNAAWHYVSVSNHHAASAHLCALAFVRGMTEGVDQHYGRPDFEQEAPG